MECGTPVLWGWFLLFSRSVGHKTKETYPTRPGSPTPCKQGLNSATSLKLIVSNRRVRNPVSVLFTALFIFTKLLPEAVQSFFASSHVFKVLCL